MAVFILTAMRTSDPAKYILRLCIIYWQMFCSHFITVTGLKKPGEEPCLLHLFNFEAKLAGIYVHIMKTARWFNKCGI